jgi:hypothetical protein
MQENNIFFTKLGRTFGIFDGIFVFQWENGNFFRQICGFIMFFLFFFLEIFHKNCNFVQNFISISLNFSAIFRFFSRKDAAKSAKNCHFRPFSPIFSAKKRDFRHFWAILDRNSDFFCHFH